jgi:hypothetical protein
MNNWPKHADGSPKKFGELTSAEKREQMRAAGQRVQRQFERPAVKAALAKILKPE